MEAVDMAAELAAAGDLFGAELTISLGMQTQLQEVYPAANSDEAQRLFPIRVGSVRLGQTRANLGEQCEQ